MLDAWTRLLLFLAVSAFVPASMLLGAVVLRVRARTDVAAKYDTYECGEEPDGPAWIRFHPRYYIVALIFVLFDVEAAFLFPWALTVRDLGMLAIAEMAVFLGVLLLGWAYAVRKGAIEWQ